MRILLAVALWLALGAPTAWVLWVRAGGLAVALCALPFAGTLALLLPLVVLAGTGGTLALWGPLAAVSALLLAGGTGAALRGAAGADPPPGGRYGLALGLAAAPLALCAVGLGVTGAVLAEGWPGYGWDGLAIWLVRAKVLAESASFPARLFAEPLLAGSHWDYPLALPALVAAFARIADLEVRAYASALGVLLAVFPVASALGALRLVAPSFAAAVALAPLGVPSLVRIHFEGYADPLLVSVGTAGVLFAAGGVLRRDPALAVLAGLALALAVSTKNEGLLWWGAGLCGGAGAALSAGLGRREAAVALARIGVPGLAFFVLWRLACIRLGAESDLAGALRPDLALARLPFVAAVTGRQLLTTGAGLGALLCGVAILVAVGGDLRARLGRTAALLAAPLAYLVALGLVYLSTPYDVRWHVATSLPRTLQGVLPLFLAAAVLVMPLREAVGAPRPAPRRDSAPGS